MITVKHFRNIIFSVVFIFSVPLHGFSISSTESFYYDLINAIKNAKGTLDVYVAEGNWSSTVRGAQVIWYNEQETRVTFEFDYKSGSLNQNSTLKVTFSPAINVWVNHGTRGLSLTIRSINYDDRGNKISWDANFNNKSGKRPPTDPREDGIMAEAVGLYPQANRLFKGELFRNFYNSKALDPDLNPVTTAKPFITKVALVQQEDKPGLSVDLKENSVIYFSHNINSSTSDNFIKLGQNSHVIFDYITYDVYSKEIEGSLKEFVVTMNTGAIRVKPNIDLMLEPQSSLTFDNVYFKKDSRSIVIDCAGSITGNLQAGSRINLTTKTDNPSWIVFDDNTSVALQKVSLTIQDKKETKLVIGGGSSIDVAIRDAQLGIGTKSFLDFGSGRITANLNGDWSTNPDDNPNSTIQFTNINAPVNGGKLYPNTNSELLVESGNFKSTDLTLVGLNHPGLIGRITQLDLAIKENSKVGIPNGFEMIVAPGSSVVGATPTEPMVLSRDAKFPLASYSFNLMFHKFSSSRNPVFGLGEGNGQLNFRHKINNEVEVFDSHLIADFEFNNGASSLNGKCSITNLQGNQKESEPEHIKADLQLNINPGFQYSFRSSPGRQAGHDNLRIFPVDVNFSIDKSILSSVGNITIDGQKVTITKVSFTPQLTVTIPPGKGEHDDPDNDNSADGTHGPDELHNAQELFTDTYTICRLHIYLLPHTYTFSSEFYFAIDNNVLNISLSHIKCNEPMSEDVTWKKDGCSDIAKILGSIIGAIAGSITAGPVGGTVGAIVGLKVTDDLIENLSYKLSAMIAEKIESQKFNWTVKMWRAA